MLRNSSRIVIFYTKCRNFWPSPVLSLDRRQNQRRDISSKEIKRKIGEVVGPAVFSSGNLLKEAPHPALALGAAGLIPFIAAPWMCVSSGYFDPSLEFYQLAYGASILSFLGGVRWGLTLPPGRSVGAEPNWRNLGYAVTPSLAAWLALLMPNPMGVLVTATSLLAVGYVDLALPGYPGWYKSLRLVLTTFAVLSLLSMIVCRITLPKKTGK